MYILTIFQNGCKALDLFFGFLQICIKSIKVEIGRRTFTGRWRQKSRGWFGKREGGSKQRVDKPYLVVLNLGEFLITFISRTFTSCLISPTASLSSSLIPHAPTSTGGRQGPKKGVNIEINKTLSHPPL